MNLNIKEQLIKCLRSFIDELSISFDYLDNIKELESYYQFESDAAFERFVKETLTKLKSFEENITSISSETRTKIRSTEYDFLNQLVLFNGLLDCKAFGHENKNTKRTLVKHFYSIYFLCHVHQLSSFNVDDFESHLKDFLQTLDPPKPNEDRESNSKRQSSSSTTTSRQHRASAQDPFGPIMETMFSNPEIFNLAQEMSAELKSEDVNPLHLVQNVMSGNFQNNKMGQLIENMTSKLQTKIANGELDTKMLEEQASKLMSQLPINDLIKNFK